MTLTIKSQTSNKHYFVELDETNTATSCGCPDRAYRHHTCKHMTAVTTEVARAIAFAALKELYDYRGKVQQAARRESYCIEFNIY